MICLIFFISNLARARTLPISLKRDVLKVFLSQSFSKLNRRQIESEGWNDIYASSYIYFFPGKRENVLQLLAPIFYHFTIIDHSIL